MPTIGRAGHEMVRHFVLLGHKRIGFAGASVLINSGLPRFQGYLDGLPEHGCVVSPELIVGPDSLESPAYATQDEGYDGMRRLLFLRRPSLPAMTLLRSARSKRAVIWGAAFRTISRLRASTTCQCRPTPHLH